MRSDLTPAFIAAMQARSRRPRQLLVFQFPVAGNLYISDQTINLGGRTYLPLVEEWGELADSLDATTDTSGEIRQATISLLNGGKKPFSNYFHGEDPENVKVELYQWFFGLADTDKALFDRFFIQDPIEFDEASRLLRLDLVSMAMRYDGRIGKDLTPDDWPDAKEADVGKPIPLIVGSPGRVPTLCAKTAPAVSTAISLLRSTRNIDIEGDLSRFPASGLVQIESEEIIYSSRTDSRLVASYRGVNGTDAAEHSRNSEVVLVIDDHTYLIGEGPITSIESVQVYGQTPDASTYTVRPDLDPARIIFTRKPQYMEYSNSIKAEVFFDDVAGSNNAQNPTFAFWKEQRAEGSRLNKDYTPLALIQEDPISDHGDLMRVHLLISHFSNKNYTAEEGRVWVEGLGDIGALSRPNDADTTDISGEVDIDHPHIHKTGAPHPHPNRDPDVNTYDPNHNHATNASGAIITDGSTTGMPYTTSIFSGSKNVTFNFAGQSDIASQRLHVRFRTEGLSSVHLYANANIDWDVSPSLTVDQWFNISPFVSSATFRLTGNGVVGNYITFLEVTLETTKKSSIAPHATGLTADAQGGVVYDAYLDNSGKPLKDVEDVDDLITANRDLQVTVNEATTVAITDKFDITDHLEGIDWSWFQGREVRVGFEENSGGTNVDIYITWMRFEVEYRERQPRNSDEVTAVPVGSVPSRPDQFMEFLLTEKGQLPVDYVHSASFAAVGGRFESLNYRFDSRIDSSLTVREVLKKCCQQSRSRQFWMAGLAKLALRENQAAWVTDRTLTKSNLQMKSISVRRQPVTDLVNVINLRYGRDWISNQDDSAAFSNVLAMEDATSITQHGRRENQDRFMFDMVKSGSMAGDLAEFYLENLSTPSTFYEFNCYLEQFDLEKEDNLQVSSDFDLMRKVPMVIKDVGRVFGSGKLQQINLLKVIAENLRYLLLQLQHSDTVSVSDALTNIIGQITEFADNVHLADEHRANMSSQLNDTVMVSDSLLMIRDIINLFAETITVSDQLINNFQILINETVSVADVATISHGYGYGVSPYGVSPYGGGKTQGNITPDSVGTTDVLIMSMQSVNHDEVGVSDVVLFSDGYGSPKNGAGYGVTPYGH